MPGIIFKEQNGSTHLFHSTTINSFFIPSHGAIYAFMRDLRPLYIGKATDLSGRLQGHHKIDAAKRLGATGLAYLPCFSEAERTRLEEALILAYQPDLNETLKGGLSQVAAQFGLSGITPNRGRR